MSANPVPQPPQNQDIPTGQSTLVAAIVSSLRTQATTWIVGFLIGILTIFSSKITESIKFAINSADLRSKILEEFAVELSDFVFRAEFIAELIDNEWTTSLALVPAINEYNTSIIQLRKKQFVYLFWIRNYWGKDEVADVYKVFDTVKAFDKAIHSLNDQFELVNLKASKAKVDSERAKQGAMIYRPALENLQRESRQLLLSLSK